MRAELRYLNSPDVWDLVTHKPEDPQNFGFLVQAMVGPVGELGEESFDFVVCTPRWLAGQVIERGYLFGRHYLFLDSYDYSLLKRAIESLLGIEGPDWPTLAEQLNRYGHWEFEDYKE